MIYDANGNALTNAYDANGNSLDYAYDSDGSVIFRKDTPATTLKVMTYNVGQWYYGSGDNVPARQDADYYALQNGMIQSANADILFLVEYWDTFSKTGRTAQSMLSQYYPYIQTQGGASGYFGRAICSKYPITDYEIHNYSNEVRRYYDSATIMVGDIPVTVVVTHLNYNATNFSIRIAQLNELITYLSTLDTFICCGDYNTLDCKSTAGVDYDAMIIPLLNAGFNCANCTEENGFNITYSDEPTGTYNGCLDNIVTSSNIVIDSVMVDMTKLNDNLTEKADHMPLIAELMIR